MLASDSGVGNRPRVADLGQQPGRTHCPGARQAGEDVRVGMHSELLGDLVGERLDLPDQRAKRGQQSAGHVYGGRADIPRCTARGGEDAAVHRLRGRAAAVADPGQERTHPLGGQPVDAVLAVEPGQELQAHLPV
jgi:hypothetical protein